VEDDPLSPSSLVRHHENWNGRLKAVAACGGKNRSQTESRLEERRFKPHPQRFSLDPYALKAEGGIISFRLWMQKQGYRRSTVHYFIRALKSKNSHQYRLVCEPTHVFSSSLLRLFASTAVVLPSRFFRPHSFRPSRMPLFCSNRNF